jgi:hypothetical protein
MNFLNMYNSYSCRASFFEFQVNTNKTISSELHKFHLIAFFLVFVSARGWFDPGPQCGGRIRSIGNIHLIGTRTHDLSYCSIVPQ